jgi:fibronectin type 3 domain-containing protein
MAWIRPFALCIALLGLLTFVSCGTNTSAPDLRPEKSGGLPDIFKLDAVRGVSDAGQLTRLGKDYLPPYIHNGTVDGDDVFLDSSLGDGNEHTAWAVYRFEGLTGKRPQDLNIFADVGGLEQQYYVGLANYSTGSWEWFGPSSLPEFQIDLHENYSRYVTALGNMYFLVICDGGDQVTQHSGVLSYIDGGDELPGVPTNLTASDGTYTDKVRVEWTAGEGATSYEVYRRPYANDGEWTLLGTTEHTTFDDTTAVAGQTYAYKARSHNNAGYSGYSNANTGYRNTEQDACPGEVSASDGTYTDHVHVTWSGHQGSTYNVYRIPAGGNDLTLIGTTENLEFDDTNATAGQLYYYKVVLDGHDCFGADSGYTAAQQDFCPSETSASDGTYADKVRVEWSGVSGHTYDVYRHLQNGGDWSLLGSSDSLAYEDTTAEPGVTYYFKVVLHGHDCYSADSGFRATQQQDACPSEAQASDGTYSDHVLVTWSGVAGHTYNIYRIPAGGNDLTLIGTTDGLEFSDTSADVGVTYYYKVVLDGHDCFSADSGFRSANADACPSEAAASDGTYADKVHVEWAGVAGHTYNIYRHPQNGGDWSLLGSTQELSYDDATAEPGVTYYFKAVLDGHDCYSGDSGFRGQ